jgi:hypothetical protein
MRSYYIYTILITYLLGDQATVPRYHEPLGIFIPERCGITPMQLLSSVA